MWSRLFARRSKYWSLLITLLAGFLTVVLLLASFNMFSFTFFQTNIRNEMIRHNSQNIAFTSERYEEHLHLIEKELYGLYYNDHVSRLIHSKTNLRYLYLDAVRQQIRSIVANPLLYVEDVIIVFQDQDAALGKNGTFLQTSLFEHFYASMDYPLSFWKKQFTAPFTSALYASSEFYEHPFHDSGTPIKKGEFFPFIIKNKQVDDFYIVAMLDAKKLYHAFHRSKDSYFVILDAQGKELFRSFSNEAIDIPPLVQTAPYVLLNDKYYFYHVNNAAQPRTFINIVESTYITDQVAQLHQTLRFLMAAAIAVSVGVSLLFSVRFYRPVKQIIEGTRVTTHIKEFDMIGRKLHDLLEKNTHIERNLRQKNKQLLPYLYFSALKKIDPGTTQASKMITMEFPFQLLLFDIHFKAAHNKDAERIVCSIRELIQSYVSSVSSNTITFQVENRQILSIIGDPQEENVNQWLNTLIQHFEHDKPYYFFTIALSPRFSAGSDFRSSFEKTATLLKERKINDDNQIIREAEVRGVSHLFTPEQDQQFVSHLQAGNAGLVQDMLHRQFKRLARKQASLWQYEEFTYECIQNIRKMLHGMRCDEKQIESLIAAYESVERLYSPDHYESVLQQLVTAACETIQTNKTTNDPITEFALHFVQMNYNQDLTLDMVAQHLNITAGYLSTYFKEKTGKNFIDYVHEVRIGEAKRMLLETHLKIQEIANRSGYQTLNSFNRIFKKLTGMSPREFRKHHVSVEDGRGA